MTDGEKESFMKAHETLQKACWEAGMLAGDCIYDLPNVIKRIVNSHIILSETLLKVRKDTDILDSLLWRPYE